MRILDTCPVELTWSAIWWVVDREDGLGLQRSIAGLWTARDDRYSEQRTAATAGGPKVEMSFIGG